jgi:hypothetical protein
MTDCRLIRHFGYGGRFLMVDRRARLRSAVQRVPENEAG